MIAQACQILFTHPFEVCAAATCLLCIPIVVVSAWDVFRDVRRGWRHGKR